MDGFLQKSQEQENISEKTTSPGYAPKKKRFPVFLHEKGETPVFAVFREIVLAISIAIG